MKRLLAKAYDWLLVSLGSTGDFSRFTQDSGNVQFLAVGLDGTGHVGVVFRNVGDELRFLHYPTHNQALRNNECPAHVAFAIPLLKEEDMKFLAGFCELVYRANLSKRLPYSFEFDPNI